MKPKSLRARTLRQGALWLAVAGLVAACGSKNEQQVLASARSHYSSGEFEAASIELKNVLQANPAQGEARFLLGSILMSSGDYRLAEVELRKALEYKHPAAEVAPALAKALVGAKQYKTVVDEFGSTVLQDPERDAALQTSVALARAMTGDVAGATALADKTLARQPGFAPMVLFKARLAAAEGDTPRALALIDELIKREPKNTDAWLLKGDFTERTAEGVGRAVEAYNAVLAIDPKNLAAHGALFSIYLRQKDLEKARAALETVKQRLPQHPFTLYSEAELALVGQDPRAARPLVEELLRGAPNNARVLLLAAGMEMSSGALHQAESHLNKVIRAEPELVSPRLMLAQLQLKSGDARRALSALEPVLRLKSPVFDALVVAAEAYVQLNQFDRAEELYQRANELRPDDSHTRTAMALAQFAHGSVDKAFSELESIAASDPGTTADMALISARLRRREYDAAWKVIASLDQKTPKLPTAPMLRASVSLARGDRAAARKHYAEAAERDRSFFTAVAGLAMMDAEDGALPQAIERVSGFLSTQPQHVRALLTLAELKSRAGAPADEINRLVQAAITADVSDPAPRLMLIGRHLQLKDAKSALAAAQAAVAAIPDDSDLLEALGRAQLANGDFNQAINTFGRLATMVPNSPTPLLRLAEAQMGGSPNFGAALQSLTRALEIKPKDIEIERRMIALHVRANRMDQAIQTARIVQQERPEEAAGFILEGDLEASRKSWAAAAEAYRRGLGKKEPSAAAVGHHFALLNLKKDSQAREFAADWARRHPSDAAFHYHLGDWAMARRDYAAAEESYRRVSTLQPDNALALNNLAWVQAKNGHAGAVELAERALKLAPDTPAFLDTLAFALAQAGDVARAVEAAKKAVARSPDMLVYKFNLAKLQIRAGDKAEAKRLLTELKAVGDKFAGITEVESLLKGL